MAENSLFIKQGDYLSLGSLPVKRTYTPFVNPPGFFCSHPQGISMDTPSKDKYAVDLPSLIKSLKHQIQRTKNYIKSYLSDPQAYEEALRGKEQLRQQIKLLLEIEEALECQ